MSAEIEVAAELFVVDHAILVKVDDVSIVEKSCNRVHGGTKRLLVLARLRIRFRRHDEKEFRVFVKAFIPLNYAANNYRLKVGLSLRQSFKSTSETSPTGLC